MANIVTVSSYQTGTTPPSKQHNIGISSILDVVPFTQTGNTFINSVVYTNNPVLTALYCNETAAAIKASGNAPLA